MNGGGNLGNEYIKVLGDLFDKTPKAVFAAILVSILSNGGDAFDGVATQLIAEWRTLYLNSIIPQRPPTERKA